MNVLGKFKNGLLIKKNNILAVIPARGGSKGIPMKNIVPLHGKPLISYTIESALKSGADRVVVSTENKTIADVAYEYGAEVINRPNDLAQDKTPTLPVIQHAVKTLDEDFEYVVILQPTSPLRDHNHINNALNLFMDNYDADSLVSVMKVPHNMTPESIMHLDESGYLLNYLDQEDLILRRQDKQNYFARNGAAIYITKVENLGQFIFGGRIIPFLMNFFDSIDIDSVDDLQLAEYILKIKP